MQARGAPVSPPRAAAPAASIIRLADVDPDLFSGLDPPVAEQAALAAIGRTPLVDAAHGALTAAGVGLVNSVSW